MNVPASLDFNTTWGRTDWEVDTRTLRRYHGLLVRMLPFGEIVFFLLLTVNTVLILTVIFTSVWEIPILSDGTDMVCIYDNDYQQVYRAQ